MAAVSTAKDEASALSVAIERAAEALEAEVGAIVSLGLVKASLGFPQGEVPESDLVNVAEARQDQIEVPGAGDSHAIAVPLEVQPPGWMVLARSNEGFKTEERALLRGMARVLALTQRLLRVVDGERALREKTQQHAQEKAQLLVSLQQRQHLLERLMVIQRLISTRTPPGEVFDAIIEGARDLLGEDVVGLRLLDRSDPTRLVLVAARGVGPDVIEATRYSRVGEGAMGRAVTEDRLIVVEDYSRAGDVLHAFVEEGIEAAMAAPVHDQGRVIGALVVSSRRPGRVYTRPEQDVLLAFAEHVSLTLPYAADETRLALGVRDSPPARDVIAS